MGHPSRDLLEAEPGSRIWSVIRHIEQVKVTHQVFIQPGIHELGGLQLLVVVLFEGETPRALFEQGIERLPGCEIISLGIVLPRGRERVGRKSSAERSDE